MRPIYIVAKGEQRSQVTVVPFSSILMVVVMEFCTSVERDKLGGAEWETEPAIQTISPGSLLQFGLNKTESLDT